MSSGPGARPLLGGQRHPLAATGAADRLPDVEHVTGVLWWSSSTPTAWLVDGPWQFHRRTEASPTVTSVRPPGRLREHQSEESASAPLPHAVLGQHLDQLDGLLRTVLFVAPATRIEPSSWRVARARSGATAPDPNPPSAWWLRRGIGTSIGAPVSRIVAFSLTSATP